MELGVDAIPSKAEITIVTRALKPRAEIFLGGGWVGGFRFRYREGGDGNFMPTIGRKPQVQSSNF